MRYAERFRRSQRLYASRMVTTIVEDEPNPLPAGASELVLMNSESGFPPLNSRTTRL